MKDLWKWLVGVFGSATVVVLLCVGCSIVSTLGGLWWANTFGPLQNKVQYQIFNTSPQHIQAVVTQITNYCEQRASAPTQLQKEAIDESIYQAQKGTPLHEADMPEGVWTCFNQAVNYELNGGQP